MACIDLPVPTLPTLPAPLTIALALPTLDLPDLTYCCKMPPLPVSIPPIPIPSLVLNPAFIATLNAFIQQMNTYLNSIPLNCPLE
jgi:hypothetical protein